MAWVRIFGKIITRCDQCKAVAMCRGDSEKDLPERCPNTKKRCANWNLRGEIKVKLTKEGK